MALRRSSPMVGRRSPWGVQGGIEQRNAGVMLHEMFVVRWTHPTRFTKDDVDAAASV
jgi:hypothetical protein